MKTLYYPAFSQLEVTDTPVPAIAANEVLIRVGACGICGSELESFGKQSAKRIPPIIMGHEFSGTIVQIGTAVRQYRVGDRVVSNAVVACGQCEPCMRRETNLCAKRQVFSIHRQGAFAEYVNVPASSLLLLPDDVAFEKACFTEPLANGVHMVQLTNHIDAKRVLVIGAGPIGLMAQQAFQSLRDTECVVVDLNEERLAVASRLGAVQTVNPSVVDLLSFIKEYTEGCGVDIVIDAVGLALTASQGLKALRPGGALVLIGLQQDHMGLSSYEIITAEKFVFGSYAATQDDMQLALTLIAEGEVDVESWVHCYSLDKGVDGFMNMLHARDGHIKSVLIP